MDHNISRNSPAKITLPVIANELLDDIVSYLPISDQLSMIYTCWTLHDVSARHLYRNISVSQHKAKRLFKTVAESKEKYGKHVRYLKYTAASNTDIYLCYILLCDAIPQMNAIRKLSLTVRPQLSTFLVYLFEKRSIMSSIGPRFVVPMDKRDNGTGKNVIEMLPLLNTMNLHGDLNLLKIVQHRSITAMSITEMLEKTDLDYVIDILTNGTNKNLRMRDLSVTLHHSMGTEIASTMWRLGFSFPNLQSLVIRTPTVNALNASQILTVNPPIFPILKTFVLNDCTILRPNYFLPFEESMERQETHVTKAGIFRPDLHTLSFGTVCWIRSIRERGRWVQSLETVQGPDYAPNDYIGSDHPLFWDVDYSEPQKLSLVEYEIL